MGSRQKYIKDSGYEMEDDFTDALHKMPPLLAFKIGKYIENNLINPPINSLVAYVIAGVVKDEGEWVQIFFGWVKSKQIKKL